MKEAGFYREKVPGGEGANEASYRSESGSSWFFATFEGGKLVKLKRGGR
jgi:nitrous oxide reductase accessory protein NosL